MNITADVLDLKEIEVINFASKPDCYLIFCRSTLDYAKCPTCKQGSSSVHSYYQREIQDLPIAGKTVWLQLTQRRFRCKNDECSTSFFTQTFSFLDSKGKKTSRLKVLIQRLSLGMSTIQATSILKSMGIITCKTTLSELLKKRR